MITSKHVIALTEKIAKLEQDRDNTRKLIADYCWERRGHFASDVAARCFAEFVLMGCWEKKQEAGK